MIIKLLKYSDALYVYGRTVCGMVEISSNLGANNDRWRIHNKCSKSINYSKYASGFG